MKNKMESATNINVRYAMRKALYLFAGYALLIGTVHGQIEGKQTDRVANAIDKVKHGDFGMVDVEEIARAGAVQAVPSLKKQFISSSDTAMKAKIANALVRLGDKDPIYWDLLVRKATIAVESDAPFPEEFNAQGKMLRRKLSPEFIEWAKVHNVPVESAAQTMVYELPIDLMLLASTGDTRGRPLLLQAMSSPNYLVQAVAAKGLAMLHDKESIPIIISACQDAPADAALPIAEALVYFDDPRAQREADIYLPKEFAQALRAARQVPGNDPFH